MSNNVKKLSFQPRTKFVKIPTQGKLYGKEHPFHNKNKVEIFCMAGKHEDILSNPDYLRDNTLIDNLLPATIVEKVDLGTLFVGDITSILYAHRITGFGSVMEATTNCPSCRNIEKIKVDLNKFELFNLDLKPLEPFKNEFEINYKYDGSEEQYHDTYKIRFRFLRYSDSAGIRGAGEGRKRLGIGGIGRFSEILRRELISINDNTTVIEEFIGYGPADFVQEVYTKILNLTPRIEDTVLHNCSRCGTEFMVVVAADAGFFWPSRT